MLQYELDDMFDVTLRDGGGPAVLGIIRKFLDDIFDAAEQRDIRMMKPSDTAYPTIIRGLHQYICFALYYLPVQKASGYDLDHYRRQVRACIVAMVQQSEDNNRYAEEMAGYPRIGLPGLFLKWVRTVGGDHIAVTLFASSFMCTLSPGKDVFPTAELKYMAQDCATHISVLGRIGNDRGSRARDVKERNVNTVHFPEFLGKSEGEVLGEIERIEEYERELKDVSLRKLRVRAREVMGEHKGDVCVNVLEMLSKVTDVYTALYGYKDLGQTRDVTVL